MLVPRLKRPLSKKSDKFPLFNTLRSTIELQQCYKYVSCPVDSEALCSGKTTNKPTRVFAIAQKPESVRLNHVKTGLDDFIINKFR